MIDLGKYAEVVLSAYGASFVMLAVLVLASVRKSRKALKNLQKAEERRNG
jgi:heme exporter protein D